MRQSELDRSAYRLAWEYLIRFQHIGLTEKILDEYLNPDLGSIRASSLAAIYNRLLESAVNRGMSSGVIKGAIGGIDNLGTITCSFEPVQVSRRY